MMSLQKRQLGSDNLEATTRKRQLVTLIGFRRVPLKFWRNVTQRPGKLKFVGTRIVIYFLYHRMLNFLSLTAVEASLSCDGNWEVHCFFIWRKGGERKQTGRHFRQL